MSVPMTAEALEALKYPVPDDHGSTRDAIAGLISDAPAFTSPHFPGYTIEIGYSMTLLGLEDLAAKARKPAKRQQHRDNIALLHASYAAFKRGDDATGMQQLQAAYRAMKGGK